MPSNAKALRGGDIVNVDVTVYFNGYHGDLNETFYVGEVDDNTVRLVNTTYECIMTAIAACKPGVRYREIGNIVSKIAHAQKCSVVRSYCGHGIHSLFHTAPSVPHYASECTPRPGYTDTVLPSTAAVDSKLCQPSPAPAPTFAPAPAHLWTLARSTFAR